MCTFMYQKKEYKTLTTLEFSVSVSAVFILFFFYNLAVIERRVTTVSILPDAVESGFVD